MLEVEVKPMLSVTGSGQNGSEAIAGADSEAFPVQVELHCVHEITAPLDNVR